MIKIRVFQVWLLPLILQCAKSDKCYFDFEENTELMNFDLKCNGQSGTWILEDRPPTPEPPPELNVGDRVLTNKIEETACMRTLKDVRKLILS